MNSHSKYHLRMIALILLFMFCAVAAFSQKNTLYGSLSLPDRGLGFRYERNLIKQPQTNSIGVYIGATIGKYKYWYQSYLKHAKINAGVTYFVHTPGSSYTNIFVAGLNYHFYSGDKLLDPKIYFPASFDIGAGLRIKRINVLMTYDVLKKDSSLNFGYTF